MTVYYSAGIEFGDVGDGGRGLGGVEVDYILVGELEWEDDGVGGENAEVWVKLLLLVRSAVEEEGEGKRTKRK